MTSNAKKQIENNIRLLEEAQEEILKQLVRKETDSVLELLENCQAVAIQTGTTIEESEGEGVATVVVLEEYCELIYRIHESLCQNRSVNTVEIQLCFDELLARVKKSIQKDIRIRKEVVFLPYKASMWDSLESVWMAADADPECDAYVIPIPYYDKNPDGSFREEHYEGDEYPEYVPITHYQDYSFEQRHPDKIYIHNPYDEHNMVTSVHPFFYAKNIKRFTENLVYIPYFVLDEISPDNKVVVAGMEHFVTVSAVIHADTVIVQSEDMRQIYIDVMCKEAGENTRPFWEKKILGTGSPKYDKLKRVKREELNVPEEWCRLIYKPDGSTKKVILYNTSVAALLEHEEKMLAKMQRVFQIFKENREDVALLWRPHPLIKATIASMRPQLWEEYEKLVEQYQREGFGIYDDTADLDRAIALCDAYYGDASSLVQLCRKVGKPVMIQCVEV